MMVLSTHFGAFILANLVLLGLSSLAIGTHLTNYIRYDYLPSSRFLSDEWFAIQSLASFVSSTEMTDAAPEMAIIGERMISESNHSFDHCLRRLRREAVVKIIIGAIAFVLAPLFSAYLLQTTGAI